MKRVVELRQTGITTISGEHVLGKVVGSYAKKVHAARELLNEDRRGGDLDHYSQRDWPGVSFLFPLEGGVNPLQFRPCLPKFVWVGNHRKHDAKIATMSRAQDGA